MQEHADQIRKTAKKLLQDGVVDCVIGYRKGSVPLRDAPYIAYSPEEAENLTWSSFCTNNLANF